MAREEKTVGATGLAAALGVHRNTIANWLRNKIIPQPDMWTLGGRYARWKLSTVRAIRRRFKQRDSARAA